ncbi:hypothetical protein FA15DRAFT_703141 [Coprinopsis marcescibilis]|nr:hypothetical protein FA15DRAFT_703141 [Coprinopsis marcescibilis]
MGAGLSSSLDKREKKRQEERNRKYIANDRVDPEEQKALSRKTEPVAPRTGTIDVDRGSPETLQMLATANEASVLERMKDGLTSPAQVEHMMEGGILNNAKGVNIEGSATLISARNNVTNVIYNTIVQPDVSEKDAKMLKNFVEWISDINYHAIQADNYRKRAEGTGTWAIEEPIIRQWFEGALGILWGIGMRRCCAQ